MAAKLFAESTYDDKKFMYRYDEREGDVAGPPRSTGELPGL
jgi:hypothetical protein